MPKVSKVGKFRQTAAFARNTTTSNKSHGSKANNITPKNKEYDPAMELDKIHVPSPKSLSAVEKDATFDNKVQKSDATPHNIKSTTKTTTATNEESLLSRGQRKRQAKRDQYLRKEKMILLSLQLQKEQDQKKRMDGLDALKEALLETVQESPTTKPATTSLTQNVVVKSNKAKQRLASSELVHMSLVLQHPVFQSNPFETIQAHLRNTLAPQGKQQEAATALKLQQEQQATQQRKQAKKERLLDSKGNNKGNKNNHKKKKTKSKFKATRTRSGKKR